MWAGYDYFGAIPYKNITLAFKLIYGEMGATVNISQIMDITKAPLNPYTYA